MKKTIRLTLLFLLGSAFVRIAAATPPLLPSPLLTPGDVLTTDAKTVCTPGYTKTVRNVPQSLKNQVYRSYGITSHKPGEYEIDHLVSLELGGSNSLRNLWPQSYVTEPLNAHVKDRLENRLHDLVCAGKLPLEEAQKAIASDWTKAYIHYVGTPPQGTGEASASPPSAGMKRNPDGSCPPSAPVKVSRSGLYHVPGDPSYARTKAKVCFASVRRAKAAGYRAPKR